jgi:hypothetical protein
MLLLVPGFAIDLLLFEHEQDTRRRHADGTAPVLQRV